LPEKQILRAKNSGGQQQVSNKDFSYELDLKIDQPATYCIQVLGYLDENWSSRLGGLEIVATDHEGKKMVTTLSGTIIDQAALFGILKALYDMRLPLLSVECLEAS